MATMVKWIRTPAAAIFMRVSIGMGSIGMGKPTKMRREYVPVCVERRSGQSRTMKTTKDAPPKERRARSARTVKHPVACPPVTQNCICGTGSPPTTTKQTGLDDLLPRAPSTTRREPAQRRQPRDDDDEDVRQLEQALAVYGPPLTMPSPIPTNKVQTAAARMLYAGDFVASAAMLMDVPKLRVEYPDVKKRYKIIAEWLFHGAFRKDSRLKYSVFSLYRWKLTGRT
jgi:hypothetical protein